MRATCLAFGLVIALSASSASSAQWPQAERLVIDKSERLLTIIFEDGQVRTLAGLRFGDAWDQGPKRQQGDEKTPEGEYRVLEHRTSRLDYPNVTFLPALYLDYPNEHDVAVAESLGVHPGSAIMIHGPHPDFTPDELADDWTDGCAALTAAQMAYLMAVTREGTPVTIQP
jgi:murein L,D-transpeptidase YafK